MVYSNLNSTIFYKETGDIDNEDIGHESTLYEMELFNKITEKKTSIKRKKSKTPKTSVQTI